MIARQLRRTGYGPSDRVWYEVSDCPEGSLMFNSLGDGVYGRRVESSEIQENELYTIVYSEYASCE